MHELCTVDTLEQRNTHFFTDIGTLISSIPKALPHPDITKLLVTNPLCSTSQAVRFQNPLLSSLTLLSGSFS